MNKTDKAPRAAIYARFSTNLQNDKSISDQIALCAAFAKRQNLTVAATFSDRAKSGASTIGRDGLAELMAGAIAKKFDVVVVESLDRISRDQEDLHGLFKRLAYRGIDILTVNDGTATSMHVTLRGMVGEMFLKDLGDKVRRHHSARAREGKICALGYGYRCIEGKPGEREIDPEQAKVVRRIHREYVAGVSPRAIAAGLNRDGIPAPRGGLWNHHAFLNNSMRNGIIGNPLYAGHLVWNRWRTKKNPDTNTRTRQHAPAEELITTEVPHLRIIDDELWNTAVAIQKSRAVHACGATVRRPMTPRRAHLLAGLVQCKACGNPMRLDSAPRGKVRIRCSSAGNHSRCAHTKSYDLDRLQAEVFKCMRERLTDPALIAEGAKSFIEEWTALHRSRRAERSTVKKRLAEIEAAIMRYCAALEKDSMPAEMIYTKLQELERERAGLAERARLAQAESNVVDLHPGVLEAYRANVEKLHTALTAGPDTAENREAFRMLVDSIVVKPTPARAPYAFEIFGRLGAIMGADLFPTARDTQQILTEQGFTRSDTGASVTSFAPISERSGMTFSFGPWREKRAA